MTNRLLSLAIGLIPGTALACPGCVGNGPNDKYTFLIVTVFVVACYVPMYVIYNLIVKNKNANERP